MDEPKTVDVMPVNPGDVVKVVDENYRTHSALVTCVHGVVTEDYAPCINVVYISDDASKRDPYGHQKTRHFPYLVGWYSRWAGSDRG